MVQDIQGSTRLVLASSSALQDETLAVMLFDKECRTQRLSVHNKAPLPAAAPICNNGSSVTAENTAGEDKWEQKGEALISCNPGPRSYKAVLLDL